MEIRWNNAALDDFEDILCYLEQEFSITTARKFRAQVISLTEKLANFPQIGKHEPLLADILDGRIRSIPVDKLCKLVYIEIEEEALLIIALWSTRRKPDSLKKATSARV